MANLYTNNIDVELIKLLQDEFTSEDQKQFATNFQMYLAYSNNHTKYVVDLENVWEALGFVRKCVAKKTLEKNFEENVGYIVENKNYDFKKDKHGGNNKETILMNVDTFKGLTMISNTEKGKKARAYYVKMEIIFFKYLEDKQQLFNENFEDSKRKMHEERQQDLLNTYKDMQCVYIIKIRDENNDNFLVKLGETDNIKVRMIDHKQNFKGCFLLDVFPCNRPHKFEQYLLKRPDIKEHRLPASEIISLTKEFTYKTLRDIIEKQLDFFDKTPFDKKLEYAKSKMQEVIALKEIEILKLLSTTEDEDLKQLLIESYKKLSKDPSLVPVIDPNPPEKEPTIPISNRRVYKYLLDDLKNPVATFYSFREAARSLNDPKIHDYHIRTACLNNAEQSSFRWFYVDDSEIPPTEIPKTEVIKQTTARNKGLVAQINKDKSAIINVYPNLKSAAESVGAMACSITVAIKRETQSKANYWKMYNDCSEELKLTFHGEIPQIQLANTSSKSILRIDPDTNDVLETYSCIQDVCNLFRTCHKTLYKFSKSGDIYKNYIWRIV